MYNDLPAEGRTKMMRLYSPGHPDRFANKFRMSPRLYETLVRILMSERGLEFSKRARKDSVPVDIHEAVGLAIDFLARGNSVRDQSDEWGRTKSCTHKWKWRVLNQIVRVLYPRYVTQNTDDYTASSRRRLSESSLFHHFSGAVGAVYGTHIAFTPEHGDMARWINRMGYTSTNVTAVVNFDMCFTYVFAGLEGSTHDSTAIQIAHNRSAIDLPMHSFLLGDAGYPLHSQQSNSGRMLPPILTPYRGTRYHLKEYGNSTLRPRNRKEILNLQHAKLRNVVERTFGVLKKRFRVFRAPLECQIPQTCLVIYAACALHNFIRKEQTPQEDEAMERILQEDQDVDAEECDLDLTAVASGSLISSNIWRDDISQAIWQEYSNFPEIMVCKVT